MTRRKFLATVGALVCSGCLSSPRAGSQTDSTITITNRRNRQVELSVRFMDGESAFAVEGLELDVGETSQFEQAVPETLPTMSVVVKILNPVQETYKQRIRAGASKYTVQIQSDGIEVIWE